MTSDQRDLLQALAYLYLRHGQNQRALTLTLLAARDAPDDVGIMRTLAYAFVANDAPGEALEVIDRLEQMDFAAGADQMHRLLKARALLHAGRRVEAKAVFRQFVDSRLATVDPFDSPGNDAEPAILHPDFVPESEDVIDIPADRSNPAASA
jgi:type III secretion protein Y